MLWLVGSRRSDTLQGALYRGILMLWLVGSRRSDTFGWPRNLATGWSCDETTESEKEQLIGGLLGLNPFFSKKDLHFAKLTIGDRHKTDLACVGQDLS